MGIDVMFREMAGMASDALLVWHSCQAGQGGGECQGWRQSGGCKSTGPRETRKDRNCDETIPSDASGYCDCRGGLKAAESNCRHKAFVCQDQCRLALSKQHEGKPRLRGGGDTGGDQPAKKSGRVKPALKAGFTDVP